MKDRSHELRRVARPGRDRRVRDGNRARLLELRSRHGRVLRQPHHRKGKTRAVRAADAYTNWIICRRGPDVLAVEPNREWENVFTGPDAHWDAVLFAAAEMRKETSDAD